MKLLCTILIYFPLTSVLTVSFSKSKGIRISNINFKTKRIHHFVHYKNHVTLCILFQKNIECSKFTSIATLMLKILETFVQCLNIFFQFLTIDVYRQTVSSTYLIISICKHFRAFD